MGSLVLIDDSADWLSWFARRVELSLDVLCSGTERPDLRLFANDEDARAFVSVHFESVVGVIQDLHRSQGKQPFSVDKVRASEGFRFLFDVVKRHLPGKRVLVVTGSLPSSVVRHLSENRKRVDFLDKRDVTPELLLAKVHWLLEADHVLDYDEAESDSLIHAFAPVWDEICRYLAKHPDSLYALDSRRFEELVAELFRDRGWEVQLTARSRDHGYDIIALRRDVTPLKVLIEAKRYAPGRPVPVGIVRALFGIRSANKVSKVVLATSSHISSYAKSEFTAEVPWQLSFIEGAEILEWCRTRSGIYVRDQDDLST